MQAQKANGAALRQYTWKSRTELKLKGESKKISLDQVRYDLDGKLQKTPLTAEAPKAAPAPAQSGRRDGRLKNKIIENKKEEFAELLGNIVKLVGSYGQLPPDKLQAFAKSATMAPGEGELAGTARIRGADVLQQGDTLSIWIDPAFNMMRRVEIATSLDGKPVRVASDYRTVPEGPTYQARSVVTYPDKKIEVTVDNYDHQRVAP